MASDKGLGSYLSWGFGEGVPATNAASPLSEAFGSGNHLGDRYQLRQLIGGGAMGSVYLAWDAAREEEVAIKLTHAEGNQERLRREGQITRSLTHPGILRLLDIGAQEGRVYLVYELVHGCRTLAEASELSRGERIEALIRAAEALGHAHSRGVVHRDVKPSNLLLDHEGRLRVADFGLAKAVGLARMTQTGALVGTPLFMAPELFDPDVGEIGSQADVWSLGVALYETLAGQPPFDAGSLIELRGEILHHHPPPLMALDPTLNPAVCALVMRCLEKAPSQRPSDGSAVAAAFAGALRPATTRGSRARLGWGLAGLALGLGGSWLLGQVTATDLPPAPVPIATPSQLPTATPSPSGEINPSAWSFDGGRRRTTGATSVNWSMDEGVLSGRSLGNKDWVRLPAQRVLPGSFRLKVRVRLVRAGKTARFPKFGIGLRADEPKGGYSVWLDPKVRLLATHLGGWPSKPKLRWISSSTFHPKLRLDRWHELRVERRGTKVWASLDGQYPVERTLPSAGPLRLSFLLADCAAKFGPVEVLTN